jgi:hypothetical protein
MASTDFTDNVTVIQASWLDDADVSVYSHLTPVSGTTGTFTATGPVGLSALSAGQRFRFIPPATTTGAAALAITGNGTLGAKNIRIGGSAGTGGEIRSGIPADVVYDGTQFHLMGPFSGGYVPGDAVFGATVVSRSSIKYSSATAGVGYATGAGGTQTQGTSKSTTVVLNTVTGEVTMHNAELAADTTVSFTLTNSAVASGDHVLVQHVSGGTVGSYLATAVAGSGSATVYVRNITASPLSEAVVLKFSVLKAVTS